MGQVTVDELRQYRNGELSGERRTQIKHLLETNDYYKSVYEGLEQFTKKEGEDNLSDFISVSKGRIEQKLFKQRNRRLPYYLVAASIAVLIGFTFVLQYINDPIEKYDFQDAGLPVLLSGSSSTLGDAMNAYKLGDYDNAIDLLEEFIDFQGKSDTTDYYLGTVFKAKKEYTRAIDYYQLVPEFSKFYEKAEYQKALCYWYLDDIYNAKLLLKSISEKKNHSFADRARKALEEI